MKYIVLILALLLTSCANLRNILGDDNPPPPGHYESVPLYATDGHIAGSLLVSRGGCSKPDTDIIERRANAAVVRMREAWPTINNITLYAMPVVFSRDPWAGNIKANGVYHYADGWIELRCDKEFVIEHEMYHALGHLMRVPCWRTIGHGHEPDCTSS